MEATNSSRPSICMLLFYFVLFALSCPLSGSTLHPPPQPLQLFFFMQLEVRSDPRLRCSSVSSSVFPCFVSMQYTPRMSVISAIVDKKNLHSSYYYSKSFLPITLVFILYLHMHIIKNKLFFLFCITPAWYLCAPLICPIGRYPSCQAPISCSLSLSHASLSVFCDWDCMYAHICPCMYL